MYRLRGLRSGAYRLLWAGILLVLMITVSMWINCSSSGSSLSSGSSGSSSRKLQSGNIPRGDIYQDNAAQPKKKSQSSARIRLKSTTRQTYGRETGGAGSRLAGSVWGQDSVRREYENYDDVAPVEEMPDGRNTETGIVREPIDDTGVARDYIGGGSNRQSRIPRRGEISHYEGHDVDSSGLDCHINDEYQVPCVRTAQDVYIPFSFISKYFEVTGKLVEEGGVEYFDWQHSHAQIYQPNERYKTDGIFMSFEHYNVEVRNRVKCVSGAGGVPVSTQWGIQGYFYPIQIAQYGLSHYSKYIIEQKDQQTTISSRRGDGGGSERPERAGLGYQMICDGQAECAEVWQVRGSGQVQTVIDAGTASSAIEFESSVTSEKPEVSLPISELLAKKRSTMTKGRPSILSFSLRLTTNGSVSVVVEAEVRQPVSMIQSLHLFEIHYVMSDLMVSTSSQHIYYGLGKNYTVWRTFTRDVSIDLQKGLLLGYTRHRRKAPKILLRRIISLNLRGSGSITNVSVAKTAHLAQFYAAADWFVAQQDLKGGWPINVTRTIADGISVLSPGWYSAMAQGQAISVLSRAFLQTKNSRYLDAAVNAVKLFDVMSDEGGVLTSFAGRYPWYEEYPTNPSSFVLNGFIYSLIGLYDLKEVASGTEGGKKAEKLYRVGLSTLKALLALFDTGSGSVYDLRHFSLPGTAPNIARWDYHATHINQLLLLATVEDTDDRLFETVAKRWMGYMKGKRAPHN